MYKNAGAVVALVVLSVCVSLPSAVDAAKYDEKDGLHNIARGTRKTSSNKPVDYLLFHDSVKVDGDLFPFPKVQAHDVCFPTKGTKHAKFTITAFNLADAGKGGLAYVKKGGGVGKHKVCFHLVSQRGHGYHFNIDVWGYYN